MSNKALIKQELTEKEFRAALPSQIRDRVTVEVMRGVNTIFTNPTTREHFRENLLNYTGVLKAGRFNLVAI